jgi:hypothetical protein
MSHGLVYYQQGHTDNKGDKTQLIIKPLQPHRVVRRDTARPRGCLKSLIVPDVVSPWHTMPIALTYQPLQDSRHDILQPPQAWLLVKAA